MKTPACALVLLSWCALAPDAIGQITAAPEFTGELFEHFQTWHEQDYCLPDRVFNGTADVCSFTPQGAPITLMQVIGYWQGQCSIEPKTFPAFGVSWNEGVQYWTFDEPVRRFGGSWGVVYHELGAQGLDFTFYDAALAQIGAVQHVTLACGVWQWAGWDSTVPVKRIIVRSIWPPAFGGAICMDAMQADVALPGPPCYANCDGSTVSPILNVQDFGCFLSRYAAGEPYANCDNSTQPPVLNVQDFGCFLSRYASGCP